MFTYKFYCAVSLSLPLLFVFVVVVDLFGFLNSPLL